MNGWSEPEWLTLQLGPFWVMSALTGRDHFDELEQEAFVRAVEAAPSGDCALSWQLMQAVSRNSEWLFGQFMLDDRSIVTGLNEVTVLLERTARDVSRETRAAMLRVGSNVTHAFGPFGRRITERDTQTLELVAQLLESATETVENNPLNADLSR